MHAFITRGFAGDGQQGGDAERDPPRHRVDAHPKGHPGNHHDEDRWHVRLYHMEPHRAGQMELGHQAAVVP